MKEKKSKEQRRKYDAEFKEQVLQMIANGRPVKEVAESLGIGENLIYRWRSRQESKGTENASATTDQQALLQRIRELEMERDIFKKSVGHFQPAKLKERSMFVRQPTQKWPLQVVCQVLGLSRSAYYSWLSAKSTGNNQIEDQVHKAIEETFRQHRRRYGVRRIVAELQEKGIKAGSYQVRQVMQRNGLKAIQPRSFVPRTTDSRHPYPISPNLLLEHLTSHAKLLVEEAVNLYNNYRPHLSLQMKTPQSVFKQKSQLLAQLGLS